MLYLNLILILISIFSIVDSTALEFNKAIKLYSSANYNEARETFTAIVKKLDTTTQSKAYFYIANSYFKEQDFIKSIHFYKEALRKNSNFYEAKYNLTLARHKLDSQNFNNPELLETERKIEEIIKKSTELEIQAKRNLKKNQKKTGYFNHKNW